MKLVTVAMLAGAVVISGFVGGCTPGYKRDGQLLALTQQGEFGRARDQAERRATPSTSDRSYMLDRIKVVELALADGVPEQAEPIADRLYDFLRTQGVNANNGFGSFVFGEQNARVWKGEPFEQAMALAHIAVLDGMNGDWGNVRASANSSLFQIRDVSKALEKGADAKVDPKADEQAAQRQRLVAGLAMADEAAKRDAKDKSGKAIEEMTAPAASNFALGYVLKAIATKQLSAEFPGEAEEVANQLQQVAPQLGSFAGAVRTGSYNTVLVVDYGLGPEKYQTGPDGAIASFRATTASGAEMLRVSAGGQQGTFPVVCDTNEMAFDLRWNNLEDVRLAKSYVGTGLLVAGGAMVVASNDSTVQLIGAGLMAAGALMKATAGADTRHVETLPQRTYVALLNLTQPTNTIDLSIDNIPSSRLVLAGVPAPQAGKVQMRYVRLPQTASEAWTTSGQILYASDETGTATSANYPYILGGRCVKTPNDDVLASYQRSGYLKGFSLNDLIDLYKEEGIMIAGRDPGTIGVHILEGGNSLFTPRAGTAGFARLYGQEHGVYRPRSARVRQVAQEIAGGAPTSAAAAPGGVGGAAR